MKKYIFIFLVLIAFKLQAQYFNAENSIPNTISFKDAKARALFDTYTKSSDLEPLINKLNTLEFDSLAESDQINIYLLKSLLNLNKHFTKNAVVNANYAKRLALKAGNSELTSHANLLLGLTNQLLKANKRAIEDFKQCRYSDRIMNYQVEYLKAENYFELQNYNEVNQILVNLTPVSNTISEFDHIKCLSFLVSNASQNNDDALALIYALSLDTILGRIDLAKPSQKLTNEKIDYNVEEKGGFASFLVLQKIINNNNIGFLYRKLGDYKSSENYLLQSISNLKKIKNELLYPEIKTNIGLTYTHLERYTEADANYQEALKKYIALKNESKQAELYNIIAKNYFLSNNSSSAIQNCNAAIKLSQDNDDFLNLSNAYFILSEVYAVNSDYQQSQTYFKLFTEFKNKYTQSANDQARLRNENETSVAQLQSDAEEEISSAEKKALELVRIKLESKQKEQELRLIKQENEIKEKTIIAQSLEKEQALKSLELIKNQLEKEKLFQEVDKINKEKEIRGLENEKNKNEINLLNSQRKIDISEKAIKDLEIETSKKQQQYLKIGMLLLAVFLALISFGFYTNYKQKKVIEITNSELEAIGINLRNSNTKLEESVTEINDQKKIIEMKNVQIIDSINYSQRIQKSFLFKETDLAGYFNDCFIISRPRDIVSGDFYFVTRKETKTYVAVVDCTGHGVPGALISMIGYEELKHLIEYNDMELPQILGKLDRKINETLNSDNTIGSDGMDLMMVEIDVKAKTIKFCGARSHCLFYSNGTSVEIKGNRKSIGEKEEDPDFEFTVHAFPFHEGDLLYMYTDGFSDQFNEAKKKMGSKTFKAAIATNTHLLLKDQKEKLETMWEQWSGDVKQTDDITLIGIKL